MNYPNGINVIGDVAGEHDTLIALLDQMPSDAYIQAVGDLHDRGPNSKEVIEFFMEHDKKGTGGSLMANHEHMMIDALKRQGFYSDGVWLRNGGITTLNSFDMHIPNEVVEWCENLPLYMEFEFEKKIFFVSHSFWPTTQTLQRACKIDFWDDKSWDPLNIIWSRDNPIRRDEYYMQIAGHNSQMNFRRFSDEEGEFAICIDSCRDKILTGIHIPSMVVYQQAYIR